MDIACARERGIQVLGIRDYGDRGVVEYEMCIRDRAKGVPFRRNIHTILDNGPLKALMVSLLVVNMVNNIRQVAQMYFAVYVWGDSGYVTWIGLSLVLGMIFGMAISPALIRRFDKKYIFWTACAAGAVFSFVPFAVGGGCLLYTSQAPFHRFP